MSKCVYVFFIISLVFVLPGYAQEIQSEEDVVEEKPDLNRYYQYRFAAGGTFMQLSPLIMFSDDSQTEFTATDISFMLNYPLPNVPVFQPFLRVGWSSYDYNWEPDPLRWDNTRVFGSLGMAYANRFSKEFEFGGDLAFGMSQSYYKDLDDSGSVYGDQSVQVDLGGKISLNPSYQMSIEIRPMMKLNLSLGPLDKYNGIAFGFGFGVQYRYGEDPDAPEAKIRSIRFGEVSVNSLFAAMQSYYVDHPVGSVEITNIEEFPISEIEVAFFQEGFMDNPTIAARIPQLEPAETRTIDLFAGFNSEVFSTEGITPMNGVVQVSYLSKDRAADQAYSVAYDLYDRTSLTWDDDRKVAAFITPADSALRNFTSYVRQATNASVTDGLSPKLQIAMQIYYALQAKGVLYQPDPTSPFTEMQSNPFLVDSVSIARDTLQRSTGDCDDLSVAYCSLLETVGIASGIITTPGHVFTLFDTGLPERDYRLVHPDRNLTFLINDTLWVPVEITLVGRGSFMEAWRTGMAEYRTWDEQPDVRGLYLTSEAQALYRPIGLRESDAGLDYGDRETLISLFQAGLDDIIDEVIADYRIKAERENRKREWNQFGIIAAGFGRYSLAEDAFNTALRLDRNYLSAKINLGNLYYLQGEYQSALRQLHRVEETLLEQGRTTSSSYSTVLLNIAQSYYKLENYERASQYYNLLEEVDAELAHKYAHLNQNRFSDAGTTPAGGNYGG